MKSLFKETLLDVLAILWPVECVGCGKADRELCKDCHETLKKNVAPREMQSLALLNGARLPFTVVAAEYDGVLKDLIVALKHEGRVSAVAPLSRVLATVLDLVFLKSDLRPPITLVLIPSRKSVLKKRGFNHLEMITKKALKIAGINVPVASGMLTTLRGRTGQVGLSREEREENAAKIKVSYKYRRKIAGMRVILVDDIITTGASLRAATVVLQKSQAKVIGAIALSGAQKRLN